MDMSQIPSWFVNEAEQSYSEAKDMLDQLLVELRKDMADRPKHGTENVDESFFFMTTMSLIAHMSTSTPGFTGALLSAALYRLAHLPDPTDPLADMEKGLASDN